MYSAVKRFFITGPQGKSQQSGHFNDSRWWLGLVLVTANAFVATYLSHVPFIQRTGLSSLTIGIVLGIIVGNTLFSRVAVHTDVGVDYAKSTLLKAGVVLFGFRITFAQVAGVGWQGLVTDIAMLGITFWLAVQLGKRVFKLDEQTTILIGAGSSICGAAAVMATEPVVKAQAHKVSVAVATVVVFGTLSMFVYPLAYGYLGLSEHAYGIFTGSTIHEVAQVVAAGSAVSPEAANVAVIEKMLRVMMLAPFLVLLSVWQNKKHAKTLSANEAGKPAKSNIMIPWFAVLFIVASGINSAQVIPAQVTEKVVHLDGILLTIAMVALGLRTHIGAIRQAGLKPLLLAGCLFLFLTLGGYGINLAIAQWL
ncbi:MAG: YeiH family protein [Paraglaciecola sp.]